MTKTTKFVLDLIDRTLAGKDQESARELWDVLTAMRGPDDDNNTAKMVYTVPIRSAAFPKTAARYLKNEGRVAGSRAIMAVDAADPAAYKSWHRGVVTQGHYREHIEKAREVLGLNK